MQLNNRVCPSPDWGMGGDGKDWWGGVGLKDGREKDERGKILSDFNCITTGNWFVTHERKLNLFVL